MDAVPAGHTVDGPALADGTLEADGRLEADLLGVGDFDGVRENDRVLEDVLEACCSPRNAGAAEGSASAAGSGSASATGSASVSFHSARRAGALKASGGGTPKSDTTSFNFLPSNREFLPATHDLPGRALRRSTNASSFTPAPRAP